MNESQSKRNNTIVRGLRRPAWIGRGVKQRVVLVRDKSGSMSGRKAKDASAATLELVAELAAPVNKDGFEVAVVDFASKSKVVHGFDPATALDGNVTPLSAGFFGGSTNMTAGFKDTLALLAKGAEEVTYLKPVALFFTDGCHNHGPAPERAAEKLKEIADVVTVAFGKDADESLLRVLASTPQHFYRCSTGRELRAFLAAVGATMTQTMTAGVNATVALTTIQQ